MTDEINKNGDKTPETQAPEQKEERPTARSVEAILQARAKLESEQAALDKMLKDEFHKNIAVMFTDIKGSTSFFETYGDLEGRAMVQRHNNLLFPFIEKHGGKIIKTIGDAIMATFEVPAEGIRAAAEMQKALKEHNDAQDQKHKRILVRIGLNYGAAVVEEKDVFGDAVNVAARVESQADAEQILISEDLYKEVRGDDDILVRFFGDVTVKGKAEPVKIYRVIWSDEQLTSESEFKKAATRRTTDKRGFTVKGRVMELITSREGKNVKVSVFERARGEEKTVSSYDMVKIDDGLIKTQCEEVVNLLNRANKRGKITKEILKQMQAAGQIMFDHLLSAEAKEKILHTQAEHLLIRLDDHLVHIPWELLFDGKQFLCQRFSMGRIVATRQRIADVAERQISKPLRMLVVADPRNDLAAAKREGTHVRDELDKEHEFINVNLKAGEVPVNFLKSKIRDYDVIHYAGHADYDKADPGNSGWLMADGKMTSNDIKAMTGNKPMPALVFANGCQSGQTDEWKLSADYEKDIFGLANAFLITGVQHYVGTFWDILDDPGHDFALAFYHEMIGGQSVGESVRRARLALVDKYGEETIVWASYMLYGDPTFSYLADVAEAEEGDSAQAPALPQGQQPQTIYMVAPGQQAVFRGADSAALPRSGGINKTYIGIAAAVVVLLAIIAGILFKSSGGSVTIPADAAAAGYAKIEKGDLAGAQATFGSLAEESETKAVGLEGLAAVYLAKNDMVAAEQNAREAIKANPQTIGAHIVLGKIMYNRGDYNGAVTEFQAASQGTGKDSLKKEAFAQLAMAFNAQGLAASQSGDGAAAVGAYEAAAQANPKDAQANINLGQTYLAQGNPAKAQEAFQRAASANPNDSVASTLLAQAVAMMQTQQDTARTSEMNQIVKDLAAAYKSGRIPAPKGGGDEWTSKRLTLTFLGLERKGKMAMEGEDDFIKIALAQALRETGRVEVVEREMINSILSELNLASTELANEETRLKLGKLFGARLIGTGSYIRFGEETQVNIRLIETETSIANVAVAEVFKAKSPGEIAKDLAEALIAKIREAYPIQGKVKEATGETVKLNIGTKMGVAKGMKFAILDNDLIKIGLLEIVDAGPDVAVAKVVEAPPKLAPEMKVRELVE